MPSISFAGHRCYYGAEKQFIQLLVPSVLNFKDSAVLGAKKCGYKG